MPFSAEGGRIWRPPLSYAYGSRMDPSEATETHPTQPSPSSQPADMDTPVYGDDPGLGEGYNQDEGYGHNQESMLLHNPHPDAEAKEPPHRERRRRGSGIGLGTAGAGGIPSDKGGHTQTGFGDEDRD